MTAFEAKIKLQETVLVSVASNLREGHVLLNHRYSPRGLLKSYPATLKQITLFIVIVHCMCHV
jgi:hypothetical protein